MLEDLAFSELEVRATVIFYVIFYNIGWLTFVL